MGEAEKPKAAAKWWEKDSRRRRLIIGLILYGVCVAVMAALAGDRLLSHTSANHYALLADAWAHGRQNLEPGPPGYAGGNDFALYEGKWFISFPPFPAMLMLPLVMASGSAENFRDGQFIVWLSGVGPAVLFLALEKLRRTGRSTRSERDNILLALLFAFGTVYFFTAVQGTVWFAAEVVGVALLSLYILFALDAERPVLAGLMLGFLFMTRPNAMLAGALFVFEALRVAGKKDDTGAGFLEQIAIAWEACDKRALVRKLAMCAVPVALCLVLSSWMNYTRFHDLRPQAFGHEHLTVVWKSRIAKWGLFSYHYLPKNLGIVFTLLPWLPPKNTTGLPAVQINEHGLALWFTTPLYLWLLWPKRKSFVLYAALFAALGPAALDLLYQNSGWRQFGYRFSNDFSPLLFIALAVGARPMGWLFRAAAVWSVAWNLFGAATFDRVDKYYWREGTQRILYQDD